MSKNFVSIVPYFDVIEGKMEEMHAVMRKFAEKTSPEEGNIYYDFTISGNSVHCREGYVDANALLTHLASIGGCLEEAKKLSTVNRIELHGPKEELEKLKPTMAAFNPVYYELFCGKE